LTSCLAPFSRLARVSELSLSAKLALSLEGDKQLAERADDPLSAFLRDKFPSRFLLSAKRVDAPLSGWHSLSALSSLSETSTLALLQNNSFLPEIEEKLTLIPYTRLLLSIDKKKSKVYLQSYKKNHKFGKIYTFCKSFLHKSESYKTTNKIPQIYSFACPQAKKEQLTCPQVTKSQWLFTRCLLQRIQSHEMNGI